MDGHTSVVLALCELLVLLGFIPWIAPFKPNGKPQHVLGFLGRLHRTASDNAEMLNGLASTGVALAGLDPSMTLAYRSEYAKALGSNGVPKVQLPQEWLSDRLDALPMMEAATPTAWGLLPHCTERTNAPAATSAWKTVCAHFSIDLHILRSGCCGMAGLYGHEKANRGASEAIYAMSWAKAVSDPTYTGRLCATGYSCRCQVELEDNVQLPHPIEVILARLKTGSAHAREEEQDAAHSFLLERASEEA